MQESCFFLFIVLVESQWNVGDVRVGWAQVIPWEVWDAPAVAADSLVEDLAVLEAAASAVGELLDLGSIDTTKKSHLFRGGFLFELSLMF